MTTSVGRWKNWNPKTRERCGIILWGLVSRTRKKAAVEPPRNAPYLIFVCLAKSSALSIGESIRSTVKNAARLAVYEEIIISVKNHHMPATILVDTALKYQSITFYLTKI